MTHGTKDCQVLYAWCMRVSCRCGWEAAVKISEDVPPKERNLDALIALAYNAFTGHAQAERLAERERSESREWTPYALDYRGPKDPSSGDC